MRRSDSISTERQLSTQLQGKAFKIVGFNVRREIKFVKKWKVIIFVVLGHRWTALNIVWTTSRWTFRLSYVTRKGFRDILRKIELGAWKSSLRQAPSASGLSARAVAVVCWKVPLKKAEKLSCLVSFTVATIRLVKRISLCIVVESEFAVRVNRQRNISIFLT